MSDILNVERLENAITSLEAHVLRGAQPLDDQAAQNEIATLRSENTHLKNKQKQAALELDNLIAQVSKNGVESL